MEDKFILSQKIYDFLLYVYPVVAKFPKFEKFTLQMQIKNNILNMNLCISKANKGYNRKSNLNEADALLVNLKTLIRLAHDLRYINPHQYEVTSQKLVEIGNILGGVIRSVQA